MGGVFERRVPECHHRIAHEFVDGALLIEDDVAERREQAVQEMRQLLGVESFRDGGEAAHVAEEESHVACLAAELEPRRVVGQALDKRRRHVVREGIAYAIPLPLGAQEHEHGAGEVDRGQRDGGIDRIDEPAQSIERVP